MGIKISEMTTISNNDLSGNILSANLVEIETSVGPLNSRLTRAASVHASTKRIHIPLLDLGPLVTPPNADPNLFDASNQFPLFTIPRSLIDRHGITVDTMSAAGTGTLMALTGTLHLNTSFSDFEAWRATHIDFYLYRDEYGNYSGKFRCALSDTLTGLYNMPYTPISNFGPPEIGIHSIFVAGSGTGDVTMYFNLIFDTYSPLNVPRLLVHGYMDLEATIANNINA